MLPIPPRSSVHGSLRIASTTPQAEWLILTADLPGSLSLGLTLCTTKWQVQDVEVEASRPRTFPEPAAQWRSDPGVFDTTAILDQLVIDPSSTERGGGVFELAKRDSWLVPPTWIVVNKTTLTSNNQPTSPEALAALAFTYFPTAGSTLPILSLCSLYIDPPEGRLLSRLHAAVVQDIVQDQSRGGRMALALQALVSSTFALAYGDHIVQFDVASPAERVSEADVVRPLKARRFLPVVLGLVGLHVFLVASLLLAVVGLPPPFAAPGDHDDDHDGAFVLGAAWAAVAQVRGPETDAWLAFATAPIAGEREEEAGKDVGGDSAATGHHGRRRPPRDARVRTAITAAGQSRVLVGIGGASAGAGLRRREPWAAGRDGGFGEGGVVEEGLREMGVK